MAPEKRSYDDYSVGWICALPKEQTAATAMLDERHPDLPKPTNDTNTYTLGSIGSHNIVIACLPKGQYGTNSAANVAALMIRAFPSIKIGFMVGIGGGVPPKVRLGDVVVSTPSGQHPGVIQWDLGKATEGGKFERTGALSNPPGSLLTALAKLEAEHGLMGSKIPSFLEVLKEKYPRMAKKYLKSDSLQDLLFGADYAHVHDPFMNTQGATGGIVEPSLHDDEESGDESEEPCPFCERTRIIKRKRRESMRVHYGIIASGNKVIKDGLLRDEVNRSLGGDVLCFEMEAAGLMNNFPCLVIRGICDYCDSHKNKAWQEHAAAVAAAFAKELLGYIQPSAVEGEPSIGEKIREEREIKKQEETLNWLSSLDFHLLQHKYFRKCERDTGQEFINSEEVQNWISTSKQTLFSQGVPGAGKTCQMAILVNYLMEKFQDDSTVGVAYVYYSFTGHDDQKPEQMLASLIKQLAQNSSLFPDAVHQLRHRHEPKKTYPFLSEFSNTLLALTQSYSRTYILIDALDEADDSDRTTFLREIFNIQEETGLNLFATSRPINSIAASFQGSISRDISPTTHDISQYLDARISELPPFVADDAELQKEIKAKVESAIGGMFLLAQLYIGSLAGKRSPEALKVALNDLHQASSSSSDKSTVLHQAYDKSMERIQQLKGDLSTDGILIISWIVKAKRQLRLKELQEVLAIDISTSKLNTSNIPTVEHIIQSCASLVIVEGDTVKLAHHTAQEYFERPDNKWMQKAHETIANVCMAYLSFPSLRHGLSNSHEDFDIRIEEDPLFTYSVEHWVYHVNEALAQGLEASRVINFLRFGQTRGSWCQDLLYSYSQDSFCPEFAPEQLSELHVAAFFGLYDVTAKLLEQGCSPNAKDSLSRVPISWAAWNGHTRVVQLLLEKTTELELGDKQHGSTPLMIAARRGHENVIELLLDKCDINAKGSGGYTSLYIAAQLGNKAVFDLLIKKGADIEARDNDGYSPLAAATMEGHMNAVDWFLENGADIESRDPKGRTPLMLAIIGKHANLGKYLIEKGADIKVMDDEQQTPLTMAMQENFTNVLEILFQKGIDINANIANKNTPLTLAIKKENFIMAKWLIEQGADLDRRDAFFMTPLLTAIKKGHKDTVELLADKRINLELESPYGILATKKGQRLAVEVLIPNEAQSKVKRPVVRRLLTAALRAKFSIIRLLIEKGANVEAGDRDGHPPLGLAAIYGELESIRTLLDKKANIEARSNNGHTPLSLAAMYGELESLRLLLSNNANIEAKDNVGYTPLSLAAKYGEPESIRLLLANKANTEARSNNGYTPLSLAVKCGKPESIRLLLDRNAETEAEDHLGATPVVHAIRNYKSHAAQILLQHNAKAEYRSALGETLMHVAVSRRDINAVKVLLACESFSVDDKDNNGRTPLSYAAGQPSSAIVKALVESERVDANAKDHQGRMPLLYAIDYKSESNVRTLLDSEKVDDSEKDNEGRTPLLYTIERGSVFILNVLLDSRNVNVNAEDDRGRTPLCYMIELKNMTIVKILLDCEKVDVNAKDSKGRTPLWCTIERKNGQLMRLLLDYEKVDVNAKDSKGRTPLLYAIKIQDLSIIEALLESGRADINAKDDKKRTPLRYAIESKDKTIIRTLLRSGKMDINAKDIEGYTPLLYAIKRKEYFIIQLLFSKMDVNTRDKKGRTPLSRAMEIGDISIVKVLLDFHEVDPEARDNKGRTPLSYASSFDSAKVLLGTRKVRVNSKDNLGRTPLWYAMRAGNRQLVGLLVRHGAYSSSKPRNIRRRAKNGVRRGVVTTSSGGPSLWDKIKASPVIALLPSIVDILLSWSSLL